MNKPSSINHLQQPPQPSANNVLPTTPQNADDDAEIQEALNDVAAQLAASPSTQQMPAMPSMHSTEDIMFMQAANRMPMYYPMGNGSVAPAPSPNQVVSPAVSPSLDYMSSIRNLVFFSDDLKLMAVIFFVVFAVHFMPLEAIIGKYIAIDKIPYHDKILNALAIAVLVIIVKNLVLSKF
jgi:hypothetical protein